MRNNFLLNLKLARVDSLDDSYANTKPRIEKSNVSAERTIVITHIYMPNPPPQNIPPTSKHEQDDVMADTPAELDTANN